MYSYRFQTGARLNNLMPCNIMGWQILKWKCAYENITVGGVLLIKGTVYHLDMNIHEQMFPLSYLFEIQRHSLEILKKTLTRDIEEQHKDSNERH